MARPEPPPVLQLSAEPLSNATMANSLESRSFQESHGLPGHHQRRGSSSAFHRLSTDDMKGYASNADKRRYRSYPLLCTFHEITLTTPGLSGRFGAREIQRMAAWCPETCSRSYFVLCVLCSGSTLPMDCAVDSRDHCDEMMTEQGCAQGNYCSAYGSALRPCNHFVPCTLTT
jgi:hypothetical protein